MRIESLSIRSNPPVKWFEVHGLADIVVIAGPNGVGKTRLVRRVVDFLRGGLPDPSCNAVVCATAQSEIDLWGKNRLDLSDPNDCNLLRSTIQVARRRKNWTSSLLNFDSDRAIQNVQPFMPSWDYGDPDEENVSWDSTFSMMRDRYWDTVHSMFRMIARQRNGIASRAIQLKKSGEDSMKLEFADPMEPFKRVFSILLAPKQLVDPVASNQQLQYEHDGVTFNFDSLSSGEREVVNVAFDVLLREPSNCVIFFDEPELHLHPELSYKLLQALRSIGSNNQFIYCTHSPDIITASLDQSVIFLSPPRIDEAGADLNQALAVTDADPTHQALKYLGQSVGIIALGRKIVLVEGTTSSLDKQTYGSILQSRFPDLVLVPAGGRQTIESFSDIYDSVLSHSIWGVDFFMLCDGDTKPLLSPERETAEQKGRLKVLSRYHLENYFLDETVWAQAFSALETEGSVLRDASEIRETLRQIAAQYISYATALRVAMYVRQMVGNVDLMPKEAHNKDCAEISQLIIDRVRSEASRIGSSLSEEQVADRVRNEFQHIQDVVARDDDEWKAVLPGRPILNTFAAKVGISPARLKTLYIKCSPESAGPFDEIIRIFADFASR